MHRGSLLSGLRCPDVQSAKFPAMACYGDPYYALGFGIGLLLAFPLSVLLVCKGGVRIKKKRKVGQDSSCRGVAPASRLIRARLVAH